MRTPCADRRGIRLVKRVQVFSVCVGIPGTPLAQHSAFVRKARKTVPGDDDVSPVTLVVARFRLRNARGGAQKFAMGEPISLTQSVVVFRLRPMAGTTGSMEVVNMGAAAATKVSLDESVVTKGGT